MEGGNRYVDTGNYCYLNVIQLVERANEVRFYQFFVIGRI